MPADSGAAALAQLHEIEQQASEQLAQAADARATEEWRIRYLGRNGRLTAVLRGLGTLPPEARREVGSAANALKQALEGALAEREATEQHAELEQRLAS